MSQTTRATHSLLHLSYGVHQTQKYKSALSFSGSKNIWPCVQMINITNLLISTSHFSCIYILMFIAGFKFDVQSGDCVHGVFCLCSRSQKCYIIPATCPALLNPLQPQHQNPGAECLATLSAVISPHKIFHFHQHTHTQFLREVKRRFTFLVRCVQILMHAL